MQDQLKHWRTKIHTVSMEWEDRNSALLAEKKIMAGHYQSLKTAMDGFRAVQAERLKQLSLQSQAAERELTAVIQHAERILKLAEMCRKLETEQVLTSCSPWHRFQGWSFQGWSVTHPPHRSSIVAVFGVQLWTSTRNFFCSR